MEMQMLPRDAGRRGSAYEDDLDDDAVPLRESENDVTSLVGSPGSEALNPERRNKCLLVVAFLTFSLFAVAEMIGGIAGHSLSLIEDASTMLVDSFTYGFNYYAEVKKKGASRRTVLLYELVSPAISILALFVTTGYITYQAYLELVPSDLCEHSAGSGLVCVRDADADAATAPSTITGGNYTYTTATWSDCEEACRSSDETACRYWQYDAASEACALEREDGCAGGMYPNGTLEAGKCDDEGPETNILYLWIFSGINLLLDFVNLGMFSYSGRKKKRELLAAGRDVTEVNANMLSAFTHVAIDTARSLAVMAAAAAAGIFGVDPSKADAYCAFFVTGITVLSTAPLFKVLREKLGELSKLNAANKQGPTMTNISQLDISTAA